MNGKKKKRWKPFHSLPGINASCKKFVILHTEASPGWGGQELRILREAEGMRARGHTIILAVQKGGGLVKPAREAGFHVYECTFNKTQLIFTFIRLSWLILKYKIDIINTHSSLDAWLGGIAGKIFRRYIIRTRHLSTQIKGGLHSKILYKWLADFVVTTCQKVAQDIGLQTQIRQERCKSIPTGVDPSKVIVNLDDVSCFRESLGLKEGDCLVGTLCVLRGWKGISDFLQAAKLLEHVPNLKWLIVGGGVSEQYFRKQWDDLGLNHTVFFTGHLNSPYVALAAMDIFLLLSWANEGVSQSSLQAAWLEKPLITTTVGGLPEVCLNGITGLIVPPLTPQAVAQAVLQLTQAPALRRQMGKNAKELVWKSFTLSHMLDEMEKIYYRQISN